MTASNTVVNDETPVIQYTATSGQTVFDAPWLFFEDSDLTAYLTPVGDTPHDSDDLLVLTTDYTVTNTDTETGGTVVLNSGATTGDILTIYRIVTLERQADYQASGDLLAETLNKEQDTEMMALQQLRTDFERSLSLKRSENANVDPTLASPTASTVIGWDNAGENLVNYNLNDGTDDSGNTNYTPNGTGAQNRTVQSKLREVVSVGDFGATGDGTTDDTTNIQAAIDSLSTAGGALYFPVGTYILSATLTVNFDGLFIYGDGRNTILRHYSDYGDTINVAESTGTAWINNFEISNVAIDTNGNITTGAHIHIDGLLTGKITDVYILDGHVGLHIAGSGQLNIDNVYIKFNSVTSAGSRYMLFDASANPGVSAHSGDVFITNFNGRGGTTSQCEVGIEINVCDGLFFSNSHIGNCLDTNLLIDGNTSVKCTGVLFSNTWFDIGSGYGIQISGSSGAGIKTNYYFDSCIFLGGGCTVGVMLDGSLVNNVFINNCNLTNYTGHAIDISSTYTGEVKIQNNRIRSNGTISGDGIALTGDCVAVITNNKIAGTTHTTGISITGSKTNCQIDNNNLVGNTLAMTLITSGTSISQKDNMGFNPYGQPTTVTVGASPYTYTNDYGFDLSVWITGSDNVSRNSVSLPGFVSGAVTLGPDDSVTLTYTGSPEVKIWGL